MKRVHSCPHRISIAIRFLLPFFCIFLLVSSFGTLCFGNSEFQSIVLLIDNSRSMDMTDTHKWRWTSAKVLINRLQIDQWVCVIGFTDSVILVIEPTRIDGDIEQKANLERKLAVPINEVEKKGSTIGQALFRAEKALQSMPSIESQVLILMTDSKAGFTKKQWNRFLKNSFNRKSYFLMNLQDKSISVSNGQKRPHNNLLTAFLYVMNDMDEYQLYEQKQIPSKLHIFLHDPEIESLELQFTSSQKRKSDIEIKDSQGNYIFPYFETSHCTSYWIPQPALGRWQVSVDNDNQVELLAFKRKQPDTSIGRLEFGPLPPTYEPGRQIGLQIRLVGGTYSSSQIGGKVISREVEEKIIFDQTADQSLYQAKYVPKEEGKHKFIIDPSLEYIVNPPIRTVELRMYQFPVWLTVAAISGVIGVGAMVLFLFIFFRRRSTRNGVEDDEIEDEIEVDRRAEIAQLHNIIVKQKESGSFYQQEEQPESIPDTAEVEQQQDTEDPNIQSIEQIPTIQDQDELAILPVESEDVGQADGDLNQELSPASELESLQLEDFNNTTKAKVEETKLGTDEISSGFDPDTKVSEEIEEIEEIKDVADSNQDDVSPKQKTTTGEEQDKDNAEPDVAEDSGSDLVSEDEALDTASEVDSASDVTSQDREIIEAEDDNTADPVEAEITKQQVDGLEQQPEGEGIDWYIGKFLSDVQNIIADDSTETNGVAAETVSAVSGEEDLIQGVDETELEEFNQGSDVDQHIDKILSEIEVLSRE
ncbi:TPA: VWA domain-containing protein [Candidatus Poribacteria bacterium]|nr:VWA domain-containing protein [Candidatus Poribacteria bacterium]